MAVLSVLVKLGLEYTTITCYLWKFVVIIEFSGDPQPPPATLSMVAGGGDLVLHV